MVKSERIAQWLVALWGGVNLCIREEQKKSSDEMKARPWLDQCAILRVSHFSLMTSVSG